MATNRRVMACGVLGLLMAGTALAQRPGGRFGDAKEMADRQVSEMKKRLKLSDDQEKEVRAALAKSGKKMTALREKFGPPEQGQRPSPEMMAEYGKIREETRADIEKILTPEQIKEYGKMEQERRERFGGGKRGPGAER